MGSGPAKIVRVALCLFVFLMLSGCQIAAQGELDFTALRRAQQVPQSPLLSGAGAIQDEVLRVGEEVYYTLQRLFPDPELTLLGMVDSDSGYALLEEDRGSLWRYSFASGQRQILLSCSYESGEIAEEIAFNQRWLVWQEIGALLQQPDGRLGRNCVLMARDLTSPSAGAVLLDRGVITLLEGFFLPFDSLDLDQDTLVYRYSRFHGGARDTEVRLIDLNQPVVTTLATASEDVGRMILRCSIDRQLVAWDVQIGYQLALGGMPTVIGARYNLYTMQLDSSKLEAKEEPLVQLTMNRNYYMPCVYQDTIFAVERRASEPNDLGYRANIVQIIPLFASVRQIAMANDYSDVLLEYYQKRYADRTISRAVERSAPQVGKKLLTWSSNVADHHLALDLDTMRLVELPVYFSDAVSETTITYMLLSTGENVSAQVRPGLENIRVRPIKGLDADYLYFEHIYDLEPPYILRVE